MNEKKTKNLKVKERESGTIPRRERNIYYHGRVRAALEIPNIESHDSFP